jgi:hypothetical protein
MKEVFEFNESTDENPLSLIESRKFNHVLNSDDLDIEKHRELAKIIEINSNFLTDPYKNISSVFIEKRLHTKAGKTELPPFLNFFSGHSNKEQILKDISIYIKQIKYAARIEHDITLVSDEIIANVLYNRSKSNPLVPKSKKVAKKELANFTGQFGLFFIFSTGPNLHIGCLDPFGNLDHKKSIGQLYRSVESGTKEVIDSGLGIGLNVIYTRSNSLLLVQGNSKTLVVAKMPLKGELLKYKTVHYKNGGN